MDAGGSPVRDGRRDPGVRSTVCRFMRLSKKYSECNGPDSAPTAAELAPRKTRNNSRKVYSVHPPRRTAAIASSSGDEFLAKARIWSTSIGLAIVDKLHQPFSHSVERSRSSRPARKRSRRSSASAAEVLMCGAAGRVGFARAAFHFRKDFGLATDRTEIRCTNSPSWKLRARPDLREVVSPEISAMIWTSRDPPWARQLVSGVPRDAIAILALLPDFPLTVH